VASVDASVVIRTNGQNYSVICNYARRGTVRQIKPSKYRMADSRGNAKVIRPGRAQRSASLSKVRFKVAEVRRVN